MIEELAGAEREIWTRRAVTRSHIDTSISLRWGEAPQCSVNLLAHAALEISKDVLRGRGQTSVVDEMYHLFPADQRKTAISLFKTPYNFAKHADRDPNDELEIFSSFCDFVIYAAMADYRALYDKWSPRMLIFAWWFAAQHDKWLADSPDYLKIPKNDLFKNDKSKHCAQRIIQYIDNTPGYMAEILSAMGEDWIEV